MLIIAHHAEIALKGRNRHVFEKQLVSNLIQKAEKNGLDVVSARRISSRIELELEGATDAIHKTLRTTFGIKNYALAEKREPTLEALRNDIDARMDRLAEQGHTTVAFKTKRADKQFPKNSLEIHKLHGEAANQRGLRVDYDGAPVTLHAEITKNAIYTYDTVHAGPGGLPSGTGGRVLCLFSGGVDSVVAAWKLAKRGCRVDLLHLHMLRSNEAVLNSKIKRLADKLADWQGATTLITAPYHEYQLRTVGAIPQRFDLVGFKHFLLRVAQSVAKAEGYRALVTGDALGQVASQTLENLQTQRDGITLPIFSPLIGLDKQEITDLAMTLDVFETANEDYKDCCSIVAKHPATRAEPEQLQDALKDVPFDDVVEQTVAQRSSETLK